MEGRYMRPEHQGIAVPGGVKIMSHVINDALVWIGGLSINPDRIVVLPFNCSNACNTARRYSIFGTDAEDNPALLTIITC
jgi:hypothetical protein